MNTPDIVAAISPVVEALEQLNVPYYVGGSVASSFYGIPRLTLDVDLVADLKPIHVTSLVKALGNMYYIDADMIQDAIKHRSSFNIVHYDTMLKIDIFIPKARLFDNEEFQHIQLRAIEDTNRLFYLTSPEDILLNKLEWYRMGNEISDRQWNDILGILKVRGTALDMAYLQHWSQMLKVSDLLQRALIDAGLAS